ncbi:MAG: gamma-glutamylcyclotransferase [Myxococcaceae bacterium]
MDTHHDQVEKAREAADPTPRLYFAYSTVLDRGAFDEWRREHGYESFELPEGRLAEALDVDVVFDFPSRWWGGRVAGLAEARGHSVFGRLFEIGGRDWAIIQHKEGVITGMCIERPVTVKVGGRQVEAVAFTTSPSRKSLDGPVSDRFVEALVRGATAAGLPEGYVQHLGEAAR